MSAQPLIDVDLSLHTWQCYHCGERIDFAVDPEEIYAHMAYRCMMLDEADALEHARAHAYVRGLPLLERALMAHLIKHPEDAERRFNPPDLRRYAS